MRSKTLCIVAALSLVAASEASATDSFTLVVIPDTQLLSFSPIWNKAFVDQTTWIRNNVVTENIVFVTHLGDIVEGELSGIEALPGLGWENQWLRAHLAMAQLDKANLFDGYVLPYSVSLGNHDLLPDGIKTNDNDPFTRGAFRTFFGASRYQLYRRDNENPFQWYGGSDRTRWNHYQIFEAGPYTYMHINLEWEPEDPTNDAGINRISGVDDAIAWAQNIIDTYPRIPTIISSHKLLTDLEGESDRAGYLGDGVDSFFGGERTATGQIVWDRLVKVNPQIFMTLNGHEHQGPYREDGEYHQVSLNDAGLPVFEILVDYQDYLNPLTGNDPYMRLIEFEPAAGKIRHKTFSPTFARFATDADAVANTLEELLEAFDLGLPVPVLKGEDLVVILANFQGDTREGASQAILDFFGIDDVEGLESVTFSPFLTDPDSQFVFDVTFDPVGRPISATQHMRYP